MLEKLILASGSKIRAEMLKNAGISFEIVVPKIDEENLKRSLIQTGIKPRDIADFLAEQKSKKVSQKFSEAIVIGCDQILEFEDQIFDKPESKEDVFNQLRRIRGNKHKLWSAAVIYQAGTPLWRHVGRVNLQMADVSDDFLTEYVSRNWDEIQYCVGGYQLEREGVRLFDRVDGNYFNVLGLPLLELLSYLARRGTIQR